MMAYMKSNEKLMPLAPELLQNGTNCISQLILYLNVIQQCQKIQNQMLHIILS